MMKLNKKTAGAIIFAALVLLLFFSKTIYTYNMPEVTGTRPKRGGLSKLEISSGIAGWAETETMYAVRAGSVGRVHVREGDRVEKNQILFEMDFDLIAAERRLAETENNISKMEADIRGLYSRLDNINDALASVNFDFNASPVTGGTAMSSRTLSNYTMVSIDTAENNLSGQAGLIALELEKAAIIFRNTQFAFELGSQSRNDLLNAENNLKALFYKYEAEVNDLSHSIALKQIDLENLKLARESIREILRDYRNNRVVRAPSDGVVISLPAERGKFFQENALLASIGVGREFIVECQVSLDNNFISPGDTCELSNASHTLRGTVQRVRPSAHGKIVTVAIASDEVTDGETFTVAFDKNTAASFTIVPNSAINQDSDGYFIYQIKRRKGIMGDEYYLERVNVYLGDSDHQNTIIVRGITFFEPIVLISNRALSAGNVVTLLNAEEFFEN